MMASSGHVVAFSSDSLRSCQATARKSPPAISRLSIKASDASAASVTVATQLPSMCIMPPSLRPMPPVLPLVCNRRNAGKLCQSEEAISGAAEVALGQPPTVLPTLRRPPPVVQPLLRIARRLSGKVDRGHDFATACPVSPVEHLPSASAVSSAQLPETTREDTPVDIVVDCASRNVGGVNVGLIDLTWDETDTTRMDNELGELENGSQEWSRLMDPRMQRHEVDDAVNDHDDNRCAEASRGIIDESFPKKHEKQRMMQDRGHTQPSCSSSSTTANSSSSSTTTTTTSSKIGAIRRCGRSSNTARSRSRSGFARRRQPPEQPSLLDQIHDHPEEKTKDMQNGHWLYEAMNDEYDDDVRAKTGRSARFNPMQEIATKETIQPAATTVGQDKTFSSESVSMIDAFRGSCVAARLRELENTRPGSVQNANDKLSTYSDPCSVSVINLVVCGRGGFSQMVYLPHYGSIVTRCPHDCGDLELKHTGEAEWKVGVELRFLSATGVSYPLKLGIDLKTSPSAANLPCPNPRCHKHVRLQMVELCAIENKVSWGVSAEPQGKETAYVSSLWAPSSSGSFEAVEDVAVAYGLQQLITDALVLGHSLYRHCAVRRRILLVTNTVMESPGAHVLHIFWEIRETNHVKVNPSRLDRCEERFHDVFTKLRALELTEFAKIVVLDLDILVRRNIDDLFAFEAPAAVFRGNANVPDGQKRRGETLFKRNGERRGGINAGVMVLEPSQEEFSRLEFALREREHPSFSSTTGPEQDLLTEWYTDKWTKLHVKYNYQLHQLSHLVGQLPSGACCDRWGLYEEIHVLHFSGNYAPHDFLFQAMSTNNSANCPSSSGQSTFLRERGMCDDNVNTRRLRDDNSNRCVDFDDFLQILVPKYGKAYRDDQVRIEKACRDWFNEWKQAWGQVVYAVGTTSDGEKCGACGEHGECHFEHTFFTCNDCDVARLRREWRCAMPARVKGLSESLADSSLFPASLRFVDGVFRKRAPFPADFRLEKSRSKQTTSSFAVIPTEERCAISTRRGHQRRFKSGDLMTNGSTTFRGKAGKGCQGRKGEKSIGKIQRELGLENARLHKRSKFHESPLSSAKVHRLRTEPLDRSKRGRLH
eukprot:TRINITY_DN10362_c0_g1_i1.p1 TRINITY_DN10362_c0_g1~~TRINITY_DN10362_c0_g1_i1.p1  ORF type:complete len:1105 (-),score=146.40 TRINITY_DN10362_c0_g1_i1:159-3473(-)